MKSEAMLRGNLAKSLRLAGAQAQPIESGSTGLGIPDIFIRTNKHGVWAELKNLKYPLHYPFTVPFRPGQYSWLMQHTKRGGFSLLIIGTLEGVFFFKDSNIKEVYDVELAAVADCVLQHLNGKVLIDWIDNQ